MAHPFTDDPIDWPGLRRQWTVTDATPDLFENLRGFQVYMPTPVSAYLARGEAQIALQLAGEAQGYLLSLGLSPLSPALLTIPPLLARGDDLVGLQLQAMDHGWWMRRCLPWMDMSAACVVPGVRGWDTSLGVWQEACWFAAQARPVVLMAGVGR